MADPEAKPARLPCDLTALLDLEQCVELAPRAFLVARLVHGASEIEPDDRWTARDDSRLIARYGLGAVAACVQGRRVRRVELPTRSSCCDRAVECRASHLQIAALESD